MRGWAPFACVLIVAACSGGSGGGGTGPAGSSSAGSAPEGVHASLALPGARLVNGIFVADGAPDPSACTADGECTAGGLLIASSCCMSGVTNAHSSAYHAWMSGVFNERCGGTCMQPPSPPEDCEVAVRCVEGRCRNSCPAP